MNFSTIHYNTLLFCSVPLRAVAQQAGGGCGGGDAGGGGAMATAVAMLGGDVRARRECG